MRILIGVFISILLYGIDLSQYELYIKKLNNYSVKLPTHMYNAFEEKVVNQTKEVVNKSSMKKPKKVRKRKNKLKILMEKRLDLLVILNNKAFVKLEGEAKPKWVRVGDKIGDYKIEKISKNNFILVSFRNKTKIVTLKDFKKNNLNIRVIK